MKKALSRSIYLVDQDPASDSHLRDVLSGDLYSVRTFLNGIAFEAALEKLPDGVILLRSGLPDRDGLTLVQYIREHRRDLPIIVLFEKHNLPATVSLMRNGADYCLQKPLDRDQLFAALFELTNLDKDAPARRSPKEIEARLTLRQLQVLKLLIGGLKNKHIGKELGISERTVEIHRAKIMRQLDVENFASLVRLATQCGIKPN